MLLGGALFLSLGLFPITAAVAGLLPIDASINGLFVVAGWAAVVLLVLLPKVPAIFRGYVGIYLDAFNDAGAATPVRGRVSRLQDRTKELARLAAAVEAELKEIDDLQADLLLAVEDQERTRKRLFDESRRIAETTDIGADRLALALEVTDERRTRSNRRSAALQIAVNILCLIIGWLLSVLVRGEDVRRFLGL